MSNGQSQCSCCKALWVKFYLTQPLGCDDPTAPAKVCVVNNERQFWQGEDPDPLDAGFLVWNLECNDCKSPYVFQGDEKDVGLACLDESKPGQDRYRIVHLWRSAGRELMVKAIDCIKPGDTGKTAQPMKWNSSTKCWEEDTGKSAVTISDCNKWLLALPGECFKVERISCCEAGAGGAAEYTPSFPYGLTRRVKITSEIQCGYCGTVKIMQGNDGCLNQESDCEIEACNTSGRKLGCDADEYATFHAIPGECGADAPACYGWLLPNARPLRAIATLNGPLCGSEASIGNVQYKDVCNWNPRTAPTTAGNPLSLQACANRQVELGWNDPECKWEVTQVMDEQLPDWILDLVCQSGACAIEKVMPLYPYYGHFCHCDDQGTKQDETALHAERVTLVTGISGGTGGETAASVLTGASCTGTCTINFATTELTSAALSIERKSYCMFCAQEEEEDSAVGPEILSVGGTGDPVPLTGTERSVVTGATCTASCGFQLTTTKICDFCGSGDVGDPVSVPTGEVEVITGLTMKADSGSGGGGDPLADCDQAVGLELKLTGTTTKICAICPSGGGGTFTTGDDVPLNFKLTQVSAATDIEFECRDCPRLDWCKTSFWAFCVGDEETGGSEECTCVDCEETSS